MCGAGLLVRSDQLGNQIRCSKCNHAFVAGEQLSAAAPVPSTSDEPAPSPTGPGVADERPSAPPRENRGNFSAKFGQPTLLVLDAVAQAIRTCKYELLDVDRVNMRVRFAFAIRGQDSEHMCSLFQTGDLSTQLEMVSSSPNIDNQFDSHYEMIIREVDRNLLSAEPAPRREKRDEDDRRNERPRRRSRRTDLDDDDDYRRRPRRRRRYDDDDYDDDYGDDYRGRESANAVDGVGLTGFICGIVGAVLFCIPYLGGILGVAGVIFSSTSLANAKKGNTNGLAIAGLILGLIACVLGLIVAIDFNNRPRHRFFFD
jgi:hypothetical protein